MAHFVINCFDFRIELMFEKEEQRSDELETSLKLADSWKRQGDELLYSMIPRPVAERLRSGQNTLSTCQSFEEVSIIFAEVEVNITRFLFISSDKLLKIRYL